MVEDMIIRGVKEPGMTSETDDWISNSTETYTITLPMQASRLIPAWSAKEVSELLHDARTKARKSLSCGEECSVEYVPDAWRFRILWISTFAMEITGKPIFCAVLKLEGSLVDDNREESGKAVMGRDLSRFKSRRRK